MSVINDMLTALDARRAPAPAGTASVPVASRSPGSRRLQIVAVLGAAAVAATALADWPVLLAGSSRLPQPVAMAPGAPTAPVQAASGALDTAVAATSSTSPAPMRVAAIPPPTRSAPPAALSLALTAYAAPSSVTVTAPAATPLAAPSVSAPPTAPSVTGTVEKNPSPTSAAQRASLAYHEAVDLGASGHSSAAIERALEALGADPDHAGARQLAAVLMFEAKRLDEAAELLRTGLERTPLQPRLAYLLARLKAKTGDADGALALLPAGAALSGEAHGLRAAILARQGRYTDALPAYEAALRQDPGNAAWWLGLGIALVADNQIELAKQALRRARGMGTLQPDVQDYIEHKLASLG